MTKDIKELAYTCKNLLFAIQEPILSKVRMDYFVGRRSDLLADFTDY